MNTQAILLQQCGGPEELRLQTVELPDPGPGEVRIRHTAIGVNYIDIYHRTGLYPLPSLPGGIGLEAAGVVLAAGPGVTRFSAGDRVAYCSGPPGAYAEARNLPATALVRLPPDISDDVAAAILLKGMTAEYLLFRTHGVKAGDTILVHAAAGGVGLLLCSWAKRIGARVIGTVGTDAKAALARAHGCDVPVVTSREDFAQVVRAETGGRGVPVVYDSIGRDTLMKSLDCLGLRGHLVLFGQSSGAPDPFNLALLGTKSASITRPTLFHYATGPDALDEISAHLFAAVREGILKPLITARYPLADAARAHADLQGRKTTGSLLLKP